MVKRTAPKATVQHKKPIGPQRSVIRKHFPRAAAASDRVEKTFSPVVEKAQGVFPINLSGHGSGVRYSGTFLMPKGAGFDHTKSHAHGRRMHEMGSHIGGLDAMGSNNFLNYRDDWLEE